VSDRSSVLIYDGDCPYCSVASAALRRLDDVRAVSWDDDAAQAFLRAQFDATPFAMVLVEPDTGTVHGGRAAAERLCDRAGTPELVGALVGDNYDRIASAVGALSGREREPADLHGTYRLREAARDCYEDLFAAAQRESGR